MNGTLLSPYDNWPDHPDYEDYRGNVWYGMKISMSGGRVRLCDLSALAEQGNAGLFQRASDL